MAILGSRPQLRTWPAEFPGLSTFWSHQAVQGAVGHLRREEASLSRGLRAIRLRREEAGVLPQGQG